VLRAADPKALERFYLDALGLRFERREGKLAQLRAGDALIDIVPDHEAGPAGGTSNTGGVNLDHLCLRVEPFDGPAIAKHLAAQGVACGAETLRYGAEGNGPRHRTSAFGAGRCSLLVVRGRSPLGRGEDFLDAGGIS
jgi:glyoxylase I family protein